MKVYGYDDTGVARGELLAANIDASDMHFGLDAIAADLGWDKAFTSFKAAQSDLLTNMHESGADAEMIELVKSLKAGYCMA